MNATTTSDSARDSPKYSEQIVSTREKPKSRCRFITIILAAKHSGESRPGQPLPSARRSFFPTLRARAKIRLASGFGPAILSILNRVCKA